MTTERINECFALDANAFSEEMLRLLHQPMTFEHRSGQRTERDFLADPHRALIVGPAGSGKTHFLRWAEIELRSQDRNAILISDGTTAADLHRPGARSASKGEHAPLLALRAPNGIELRDRMIADLQEEQRQAQARVTAAREQGGSPDAVDREVAGWLAKGLCDLFADSFAGQPFLAEGNGIFTVIAAQFSSDTIAAHFNESDFLRPKDLRFMEASRPAQMMVTKLNLASTNQFRVAAANLMNRMVERHCAPDSVEPAARARDLGSSHACAAGSPKLDAAIVLTENENLFRELAEKSARVICTATDELATDLPIDVWKIVDLSADDAIDFIGVYLAAVREPLPESFAEIAGHCASRLGRVLYPFHEEELHAILFVDGETTLTRRTALERVRARLLDEANAKREPVSDFLAAVDSGGASLNLLTDVVIEWLRENNHYDAMRVIRHDSGPK